MRIRSLFLVGLLCTVCISGVFGAQDSKKYLVTFKKDVTFRGAEGHKEVVSQLQQQLDRNLVAIKRQMPAKPLSKLWICNSIVVSVTESDAKKFSQLKNVESVRAVVYKRYIDKDIERRVVKAEPQAVQWSIEKVNAPKTWSQYKIDGSGVVVGHLDTGIDAEHPALKGKVLAWKDFTAAAKPQPYDDQGHGTHTAGSIAGSDGVGVAPGARLIVAKIFDSQGGAEDAGLLLAMQWVMDPDGDPATNDGPRLVSNSWGDDNSANRSFWDATNAWVAAGILPVFAAGNNGPSGKVGTPGGYPQCWAVAATTKTDTIAYFSSIGPVVWDDVNYVKPDVAAPGHGVISCAVGGGLVSNSGTSMACPHVAGLAALMLQANPALKIDQLRQIGEATALDLGTPGKDNKFGNGRFDALACIKKIKESSSLLASFQAYENALMTEKALIGVQPQSPLAAPLAKSLVLQAGQLDEGEFNSLRQNVQSSCGDAAQKVLKEAVDARTAQTLHN